MERVLNRIGYSIFQRLGKWYGLRLEVQGKAIENLRFDGEKNPEEGREICKGIPCGFSFSPSLGYLLKLNFPFTGRSKIGLVVKAEMEGLLPLPVDEIEIDFEETGKGNVLVAALPRSLVAENFGVEQVRSVTLNGMAALNGLRWCRAITQESFVFTYVEAGTALMIAFLEGSVHSARQFYYADDDRLLLEALREVKDKTGLTPERYYLVSGDEDVPTRYAPMARELNIQIQIPSLKEYAKVDGLPQWCWIGLGSALLALNPGRGINLAPDRRTGFTFGSRSVTYAFVIAAAVSIIVAGLAYLNLSLQERALGELTRKQNTIFRNVFPTSPPVKDAARFFEQKIEALDRAMTVSGANTSLSPLGVLAEVSTRIETQIDVKLSDYLWDEKEFAISGITTSFAAVEKMKAALEKISGVRAVEIQSVDLSGVKQVRFRMRGQF